MPHPAPPARLCNQPRNPSELASSMIGDVHNHAGAQLGVGLAGSRVSKADTARQSDAGSWNAFVAIHRVDFLSSRSSCYETARTFSAAQQIGIEPDPSRRGSDRVRATNGFPAAAPAAAGPMPHPTEFRSQTGAADENVHYVDAGRCARKNERIWRTASGMRSFGSFHGNMLTSAFGASMAASIATAYGCAGMSSGRINTGV